MADFNGRLADLAERDIKIVAASIDSEADAERFRSEGGFEVPIGYGLDLETVGAAVGAFYDPDRPCLHATGFVLRPDGTIVTAVYSTGPIGRLTAADSIGHIDFHRGKD